MRKLNVRLRAHHVLLIAQVSPAEDNPKAFITIMELKRCLLVGGTVLMALGGTASGQSSSTWRAYKTADGLPQSSCTSVTVGLSGNVFVTYPSASFLSDLTG